MKRSVVVALVLALTLVGGLVAYLVFVEGSRAQAETAVAPRTVEQQQRAAPAFLRDVAAATPPTEAPRAVVIDEQAPELEASAPAAAVVDTTIKGRFVDRAGRAIDAVRVSLKYPKVDVEGDALGRFVITLHAALRTSNVELRAMRESFGNFNLTVAAHTGETTDLGDLVLGPSGAISGRVVDENGAALAGAEVRATNVDVVPQGLMFHGPWRWLADTTSDANGAFRLTGVAAGSARAWAGSDERVWAASDALEVPEHGEIFDVVLTVRAVDPRDTIRLSVIDPAGKPVPRAYVGYHYDTGNNSGTGTVQADEQGRCTMHLNQRAPHTLEARDPKNAFRPSRAGDVAPGTLDLVMQLGESKTLTLNVRARKGGAVVEDFQVGLVESASGRGMAGISNSDTHHVGGSVAIPVPVVKFAINVDSAGFARAEVGPFDPDTAPAEVVVELDALPGARGIVKAGGEPVRGARVSLARGLGATQFFEVNGFAARYQDAGEADAKTDEHGEFALYPSASGSFYVRAELEGWAPGDSGPFALDINTPTNGLVVELARGGTIEGRAAINPTENFGGLVIGASRGDGHATTTRTDAEGKFRFTRLTPGRWWVGRHDQEISPNSTSSTSSDREEAAPEIQWNCTVRDGETTVVNVPAPAADTVRVLGSLELGGKPAAGWRVSLSSTAPGTSKSREAELDAQGRFTLTEPQPGEYWLSVTRGGRGSTYFKSLLTLDAGDNKWEVSVPVGTIAGTLVKLPSDGGGSVQWNWTGADNVAAGGWVNVDAENRFMLTDVPAGRVAFVRFGRDNMETLKSVEVVAGESLFNVQL